MKTKFVRNSRTKRRELLIASQRGEVLDKKRAKWLSEEGHYLLLSFSFEVRGASSLLHYDVEGLWSLRTLLAKRPVSQQELLGLLEALMQLVDLCADRRMPTESLYFDPELVFVDAQCRPNFVLVPFEELGFQARNSPLALLRALGDPNRLQFVTPDAEGVSRRLAEFLLDQKAVFSANRFRRFLDNEERQAQGDAPASEDEDLGTSSNWALAGSADEEAPSASGSTLFWSPLAGLADVGDENESVAAAPMASAAEPAQAQVPVDQPVPVAVAAPQPATVQAPAPQPATNTAPAPQPATTTVSVPQPATTTVPASQPVTVPAPAPAVPAAPVPPAPAPQRAWLRRLSTGEEYLLPLGTTVKLGRGSACDIRLLGNPKLSRVHAALLFDGQSVRVTDLGAANGTWANGVRLSPQQTVSMPVGQPLRLASEELTLRVEMS